MDECRELFGGLGDWASDHAQAAYDLAPGGPWSEVGDLPVAADHDVKHLLEPTLARHTLQPPMGMLGPSAFAAMSQLPPVTVNTTRSIAVGASPYSSSSCASGSVLTHHVFSLSSTATAAQQLWPANDLVSTSEEGDWDLSAALSLAEDQELGQQLCEAGLLGADLTPLGHRATVLDDCDSVEDASLSAKFSIGSDTPFRQKPRRTTTFSSVRYAAAMISDSDNDDDYSVEAPSPKRSKVSRGSTPRKGCQGSGGRSADDEHSPSSSTEEKKRRKQHNPWTLEETEVLIAGVEQCGGGRWAEIKKLGYSVIDRRSPVDLKDKWRNLIRVACQPGSAHARSRCDKRREIPEELLARVRAVVESSRGSTGRHH